MLNRRTFVSLAALGAQRISAAGRAARRSRSAGDAFPHQRASYLCRQGVQGRQDRGAADEQPRRAGYLRTISNPENARNAGGIPIRESGTRSAIRGNSSPPCPLGARMACLRFTIKSAGPAGPEGYSKRPAMAQTVRSIRDGSLRADYMGRLERILNKSRRTGGWWPSWVCSISARISTYANEAAVRRAVSNSAHWLLDRDYRNAMIEGRERKPTAAPSTMTS